MQSRFPAVGGKWDDTEVGECSVKAAPERGARLREGRKDA